MAYNKTTGQHQGVKTVTRIAKSIWEITSEEGYIEEFLNNHVKYETYEKFEGHRAIDKAIRLIDTF